MTSARPLRTSARQSAIRHQEQEAELARQREQISLTKDKEQLRRHDGHNHQHELGSDSSSSRSLSPALSDSASLSSREGEGAGGGEGEQVNNVYRERRRTREDKVHGKDDNDDDDNDNNDDPTKPFSYPNLQSHWEIAFIYGFLLKFKSLLRQNCPLHEISMEDLEEGLLSKAPNACIEEIHINLLSNLLNRKKAVENGTWQRVFLETLDAKHKSNELEYDYNPLRYYRDYYQIPPEDRIHLLKALVHWVLQEGPVIRGGIEEDNDFYMIEPFGTDQARRVYWYFGEGTLRIFRETKNPKKKSTGWETVASNLEEVKALADSFDGTSSKAEKTLQGRLREDVVQPSEDRILQSQLKQERLEKKMLKLAQLHQLAATKTTRTRSSNRLNQPKYTFDDDDDEFEDEYYMYRRSSSRRKFNNDTPDEATQHASGSDHPNNNSAIEDNGVDQQDQQSQQERSASVEAISSTRSSVGRDSDTSILDALQRARVRDDDSFVVGSEYSIGPEEDDEENGGYPFEEDQGAVDVRSRKVGMVLEPKILQGLLDTPAITAPAVATGTATTAVATTPPPPLPTPAPTYTALPGTPPSSTSLAPTSAAPSLSILTEDIEMKSEDA